MLKRLFISLLLLLLPGLVGAAEISLADVVSALETPFKHETVLSQQIRDFQAEFFQESHVVSINRVQRGVGNVRFRFVPGADAKTSIAQFFWNYRQPDVQEIISDGRTMWVYLPDNKQVIESDIAALNEQQGQNPVTFLSSLGQLSTHFDISWGEEGDKGGHYRLQLQPRRQSQLIEQMEVVVNRKAVDDWFRLQKTGDHFPLLETMVTDLQGNRTVIRFEQIKVNVSLGAEQFIFVRPDDVELVRPEQMNF